MQLPQSFIQSLQWLKGFNGAAFEQVHNDKEPITSIRINPHKIKDASYIFSKEEQVPQNVPWSKYGYYLAQRPSFTFDPLFHAGCYYVQEASSMFVEQALQQTVNLQEPLKVLDLCAAPGGKSTHVQSLLTKDSLLVTNDVIRARANVLKDNIIKWGSSNAVVCNNDPKDFAKLNGFFDVILIDAPCSGSGLFRRDEEAIKEWSENNVILCSQRQQRIVADALPALKDGGILIYATCSFSKKENEDVVDWICDELQMINLKLKIHEDWGITEAATNEDNYGYRFWPHLAKGEGFFLAVFQNKNNTGSFFKNKNRTTIKPATRQLAQVTANWAIIDDCELVTINDKIYAWPGVHFSEYDLLAQQLRVIYSGTLLGEIAHKKMLPAHPLAVSNIINKDAIIKHEYNLEEAIAYLQKKEIPIPKQKGWQIAAYKNHPLGWMNVMPNRINNYYPKELRILKEKI